LSHISILFSLFQSPILHQHKPLLGLHISILFSLFQSKKEKNLKKSSKKISILFSLFQSPKERENILSKKIPFPYYLVYFKADLVALHWGNRFQISILFSLFQSGCNPEYCCSELSISILFSLFQSNFWRPFKKKGENIFPYYLVYFKALWQWPYTHLRVWISILFSLFQSLLGPFFFWYSYSLFPYYLVYFKAIAGIAGITGARPISILFSLFQSSVSRAITERGATNFHTI